MERVVLVIERSGERLRCLLNPETLEIERHAGIQQQQAEGEPLSGPELADDPLHYTGGGRTELKLDLLFDVSLAGSSIPSQDVRELTSSFWNLAENLPDEGGQWRPPLVRFLWGKSWNIPGVIAEVAQRLEHFTPQGVPRRAWIRMRLLRVMERIEPIDPYARPPRLPSLSELSENRSEGGPSPQRIRVQEILGASGAEGSAGVSGALPAIAEKTLGHASLWRLLAQFNRLIDPLRIRAGSLLRIPLSGRIEGGR